MIYLKQYATHETVEQLNDTVHTYTAKLQANERKVLRCLARHALKYPGACHLKAITIANEVGISRSTVTRVIKSLRDQRMIVSYNKPKLNGIMGANIYCIVRAGHATPSQKATASSMRAHESANEAAGEPATMSHRRQPENARAATASVSSGQRESVSFNQATNKSLTEQHVLYVEDVSTKDVLQTIYDPHAQKSRASFNELCKIAFGRLKQCMREYRVPYFQMRHIIIRCMRQLVQKWDVRNEFALYSAMIERQVKQLFEQPITPPKATGRTEVIPDWFETRHAQQQPLTADEQEDLEAARARVRAKLGLA